VIGGAWRPASGQEDLLEVVVGARGGAADAWRRWSAANDLESIDPGSARLLPLLMPRLDCLPPDDPARARIAGAYRRSFYHGNLVRARAARALRVMHAAGLPTLVIKGGVLGVAHYGDVALRPMNDFDALVPAGRGADALRSLMADGWRSAHPIPESLPDAYHSAALSSNDGLEFDVHWNLLPQASEADADAPAWAASEPFDVMGVATRRLCASDLLVIVCAHAAQWSPVASVWWVADALAIVRREGDSIDWDRIATMASRWHVAAQLHETLAYLRERWGVPVAASTLAALHDAPIAGVDRAAHALLMRMPGPVDYLCRPWIRYRLRSRERGAIAALPGFVRYLQVTLGQPKRRALPLEIAARFASWRRDREAGVR